MKQNTNVPARVSKAQEEPSIPERLRACVEAFRHDDKPMLQALARGLPRNSGPRLRQIIAEFHGHMFLPIKRAPLEAWLMRLAPAVQYPPNETAFEGVVAAILASAPHLPAACLSDRSFAAAVRKFRRWPAAGDLIEFWDGIVAGWQRDQRAVQAILAAFEAPVAAPLKPPTEAQIAATRSKVVSLMEHFAAQRTPKSGNAPAVAADQQRKKAEARAREAARLREVIAAGGAGITDAHRRWLAELERPASGASSAPEAADG